MELYAQKWSLTMSDSHEKSVLGPRRGFQGRRKSLRVDDERVIARCNQGVGDVAKDPLVVVANEVRLAVDGYRSANGLRSVQKADALHSEADAKYGAVILKAEKNLEAGLLGMRATRSRGDEDVGGVLGDERGEVDEVVTNDEGTPTAARYESDEVVGEGVFVVDDESLRCHRLDSP